MNNKKLKTFTVFYIVFSLVFVFLASKKWVEAIGDVTTGYRINSGGNSIINAHGVAKNVTISGGKNYFVPTKTTAEWNAFISQAGTNPDVTLTDASPHLVWEKEFNQIVKGGSPRNVSAAYSVAVDGTGIYIAGEYSYFFPNDNYWKIMKIDSNGTVIWEKSTLDSIVGSGRFNAFDIDVDATGVYAVGVDGSDIKIEKRNLSSGNIIWEQTSDPWGTAVGLSIVVDSSGVYLAGYDTGLGNQQWRIEKRRLNSGGLYWQQTHNINTSNDWATGISISGSDLFVVGNDKWPGNYEWSVEKRNIFSGALIGMRLPINPTASTDYVRDIAVDSNYYYLVGNAGAQSRIEKRNLSDNSSVWIKSSSLSSAGHKMAVKVDSEGLYIAGYIDNPQLSWHMEKRNLSDGTVIWNDNYGIDTRAYDVAVDSNYVYVVGKKFDGTNYYWIVKKYTK